ATRSGLLLVQHEREPPPRVALQLDALTGSQFDRTARKLRRDRQLPAAAIDQGGEPYARRPAVVEDFVQRRPQGASREKYVVNEYDIASLDLERNLGTLYVAVQTALVVIVAIEGNVEGTQPHGGFECGVEPFSDPHSAGVNPDQTRFRPHRGPHAFRER